MNYEEKLTHYRMKLMDFIFDDDDDAMIEWILEQPLIEQPDIFRLMKRIVEETEAQNEFKEGDQRFDIEEFETSIQTYEDKILEEKLSEANYFQALEEQRILAEKIEEATNEMRNYVIDCIITNAPNALEMRELAEKIKDLEIKNGTFETSNWKGLF